MITFSQVSCTLSRIQADSVSGLLAELGDQFLYQNPRKFYIFHSLELILVCAFAIC